MVPIEYSTWSKYSGTIDRHIGIAYMVQVLEHVALGGMYDHDTTVILRIQTCDERLLSTRVARLRGRG